MRGWKLCHIVWVEQQKNNKTDFAGREKQAISEISLVC